MAEGYANALCKDWMEARSAGFVPQAINVTAIAIMLDDSIDISTQKSKVFTEEMMHWADLLITVSPYAKENCLAIPVGVQKKHWPLSDPTNTLGTEEGTRQQYALLRDDIKRRIFSMVGGMKMMGNH